MDDFSTADAYVDPACMEVADTDGDGVAGPAPEEATRKFNKTTIC